MNLVGDQPSRKNVKQPSQEDLLGYVLGALEAQEQRDLQQQIDEHPQSAEIEDQLLEIRASMLPLDYVDTSGYRPGLARRTCESVASYQNNPGSFDHAPHGGQAIHAANSTNAVDAAFAEDLNQVELGSLSKIGSPFTSQFRERMLHPGSWTRIDILASVAMLAVIGSILFPALSYSRYNSQIAACQNNLQQVGNAMMCYSDCNGGQFVAIPREGNLAVSGCYAMILRDKQFIEDDSVFGCAGVDRDQPLVMPTMTQVSMASGAQLNSLQRKMGGDFGYTIGVHNESGYQAPRNEGLSHVVLLADMPSTNLTGRKSANHRGNGQNCLFADGRVEFVSGHSIGEDAIFENDYGIVAPGSSPFDNVIAPSHLSPRDVLISK